MKPFNLHDAVVLGKEVVRRDETKIVQIAHFPQADERSRIVALAEGEGEPISCSENGRRTSEVVDSRYDLFMASEKKEGWVNVYPQLKGEHCSYSYIHETQEMANRHAGPTRIRCVRILREVSEYEEIDLIANFADSRIAESEREAQPLPAVPQATKFYLYDSGDDSVGMFARTWTIVIQRTPDPEFTEDEIEGLRDVLCPDGQVFTEAEWEAEVKAGWPTEAEEQCQNASIPNAPKDTGSGTNGQSESSEPTDKSNAPIVDSTRSGSDERQEIADLLGVPLEQVHRLEWGPTVAESGSQPAQAGDSLEQPDDRPNPPTTATGRPEPAGDGSAPAKALAAEGK